MAHGIPCIISDCCAGVEYICNGKDGLLFEKESIEDLKKKVRIAENDPDWGAVAEELRCTFSKKEYSVQNHVRHLVRVYEEIIQDK